MGDTHNDKIMMYVSLIRSNLELAEAVEFVAIAAFAQMCLTCIMESGEHKELIFGRPAVWWLAQTGVLSVVVVGIVRELLSLTQLRSSISWINNLLDNSNLRISAATMLSSTDTLFDFVTLLCVVNMFVICKMEAVTKKVLNANLKFTGARMIVIVANIQEKALMPAVHSTSEATIAEWRKPRPLLNLDGYGCALLHVSLLTFECFLITAFHAVTWSEFFENMTENNNSNNRASFISVRPTPSAVDNSEVSSSLLLNAATV